ncbi:MAG: hypothetical protein JKY52_20020 [Flavobacteriales bacterium]|nr:hypothetical protein [Flavobacteriales bacterium]
MEKNKETEERTETEDKNKQAIVLCISGIDYTFNVTREEYNGFVNKVGAQKVGPAFNFLTATVETDKRTQLVHLMRNTPGAEMEIVQLVVEEYVPDLDIVVKKRKP